jgi:hypothetical protein
MTSGAGAFRWPDLCRTLCQFLLRTFRITCTRGELGIQPPDTEGVEDRGEQAEEKSQESSGREMIPALSVHFSSKARVNPSNNSLRDPKGDVPAT